MELIDCVYPPVVMQQAQVDKGVFTDQAILSTTNIVINELNAVILRRYPGPGRVYQSVNTADVNEADGIDEFSQEYLQSITVLDLPLSTLELKVGVLIMCLRNLLPKEGLCNSTRMVVTSLQRHCIEAWILGGDFDGQRRTILWIKLSFEHASIGFKLIQKQFPVRLCFAMTINKS
jgi:ATP-dependent DNA helicase PIF1